MRRVHAALPGAALACVACLACDACGGSSSRSPLGEGTHPTKAQAIAYANAVNLRAADVPRSYRALLREEREAKSAPYSTRVAGCDPAVSSAGPTIGFLSPRFARNSETHSPGRLAGSFLPEGLVFSGVYFFRSERDASQWAAAPTGARFAACVETTTATEPRIVTREGSRTPEPMFSHGQVSTLPWPLRGVHGYGARLMALTPLGGGPTGPVGLYEDYFGFARGNAVIVLIAIGSPHPYPAAAERALLAHLASRAQAHTP